MHADVGPEFLMTRARLFAQRFTATASLLVLAFVLVRYLWFPGGYFGISGVAKLFLILVAVNLVVGPGLSALLYKPGKWGLKFDLIVIACVEVSILGWAMHEILERRPAFVVFAVDRFEAVTISEVNLDPVKNSPLAATPGYGPRLIYARLPTDVDVMNRLIDETVFEGKKDIERRPKFWRPYAQGIATAKAAAIPISNLLSPNDRRAAYIQRWLAQQDRQADEYLYLPIQGRSADGIMILHADIGFPVAVLPVNPW